MKKIMFGLGLAMMVTAAFADDEPVTPDTTQIVTSQYYVDTQLATKQRKIGSGANAGNTEDGGSGANGDVVTYTGTAGKVGSKKVYNENTAYNTQTSYLVEAGTVNDGIKNGLNDHFSCAETNSATNHCWLYNMNTLTGPYLQQPSQAQQGGGN